MICYHGTTKKGLNAIMNGDGTKPNSPWTCSNNDGAMYVWPENKLIDMHCLDDDEDDDNEYRFVSQALESAQIQAVTELNTDLYCIVLDIPDHLLNDDYSCENMSEVASFIDNEDFKKEFIVKVFKSEFNDFTAPFIVANLIKNDYFNKWAVDHRIMILAEAISGNVFFIDELLEFDYYEIEDY